MKIISFSLWGDDKLYCQGALENVELARQCYPDWTCRFYVDPSCPVIQKLIDLGAQVRIVNENMKSIDRQDDAWHRDPNHQGMLWRFFAIDDPEVDIVIFRDCDSRIGAREVAAVQEWLDSRYLMHRMHECKEHWNAQVMGGMWGIKSKRTMFYGMTARSIDRYVNGFFVNHRKEPWIFVDLWWIMDCVWPIMADFCIGHGYGHDRPFSVNGPMVGAVVNEEWRGQKYV